MSSQTQGASAIPSFWKYIRLRFSASKKRRRQRPTSHSDPSSPSYSHYHYPSIIINGDVHIIHCIHLSHTSVTHNEIPTYLYQPTNVVNSNSFNHVNSSSVGVTNDYSTNLFDSSSSTTDTDERTGSPTPSTS